MIGWQTLKAKVRTYSLEGEVALGDHFSDLCDDLTLGVGQIDSLLPNINVTCFAVLPGLLSLTPEKSKFVIVYSSPMIT